MSSQNDSAGLCRGPFWDNNITWNTEIPDFTPCFQKAILTGLPCLVFCPAALLNLCLNWKSKGNMPLPYTPIIILRMVFCFILIALSVAQMVFSSYQNANNLDADGIDIYIACIQFITYVLVMIIIARNRVTGKKSSTLLTIFFFVLSICTIFLFRSVLLKTFTEQYFSVSRNSYVRKMIYFPVVLSLFILSLVPDRGIGTKLEEKSPIEEAPFMSFLTFYWFNKIIAKGRKKLLMLEDFPPLPDKLTASFVWDRFYSYWSKELLAFKARNQSADLKEGKKVPRLALTILKSFWPWILPAVILQLFMNFAIILPPLLLNQLLISISTDDYVWKDYLLCSLLFLSDFASKMLFNFMLFYSELFAIQFQSSIISAIYRKALRLSTSAKREYTSGEIVNIVSVDVEKVFIFGTYFSASFGSPLKVIFSIALLWKYLGPSCLSGIAVILIMIFLTTFVSKRVNYLQLKQMETKDFRLKFMTEILNGLKVLKLYAWEIPFTKKISDIRAKEVHFIRSYKIFYAIFSFVWKSAAFLIAIACFVTYILVSDDHVLNPTTVFVSLNILNILRFAVAEVPFLISNIIQTVVSMKRIAKFLVAEEREDDKIGNDPDSGDVLSIKNAIFGWDPEEKATLNNIDFHLKKGSLVAVIGPVGAGKSSFLSAILGEMHRFSGSINIKGRVAYVPQQAWVLNQTLRDNILFVNPLNKSKYNNVLECCSLKSDLEMLLAGDKTEIGEKGVNLSGGQKQRVSVARAVYNNADIYLLDDPLSAVDAHVGKHIFDHVIGSKGLLRNKSRILVTHNISVLPEVDFIITLKDGCIQESGTYTELMELNGLFADLIQQYATSKPDSDNPDDDEFNDSIQLSRQQKFIGRSVSVQSKDRTVSGDSITMTELDGKLIDEEEKDPGEMNKAALIPYARHMSAKILIGIALGYVGYQVLEVGGNVWLGKWSSDPEPVNGTHNQALLNKRMGVYAALGIGQIICTIFGSISLAYGATTAAKVLHFLMTQSVMRAPMSFFDVTPLGRILNRFSRDIEDIDTMIPQQIDNVLYSGLAVLGTFVVIASSTPMFIPFLIPILLMYYVIQKIYLQTSHQLKRLSSTTRSPIYSHLTESIQGSSSINAYNVLEPFLEKLEQKINDNASCEFMWRSCMRWLGIYLSIAGGLIILFASVLAVVYKDHLSASVVGLSITYALGVTDILNFLMKIATELENRTVSLERVAEYSKLKSEAPWEIPDKRPSPEWPSQGQIEFKNYSTRYRENLDLVLKDVNLKITENEKVGIVGRTGAGKSSITLALFRMIEPAVGTIIIDDLDVAQMGLHQLRKKLTIIPQDPTLFTGSLRINLDPNEEYTDEEIWLSLEHANMKHFVSSLPDGLTYDIAEGGENLSVGQRQLVCLARALLKKTKILILDEATAAVDVETDSHIQNTIRSEFQNHTVITIAHRLNTILDYDRVVVMEDGKISEVGNPSELLQRPHSHFYHMAKDAGIL